MDLGRFTRGVAFAGITALVLTACGGGAANKAANAAANAETQREKAALPMTQTAAVPNTVRCGAVKPVWVNLHTKAYHEYGDPYYGKTKNGEYICPAQAQQQGFHPAGARHKGMSGANGTENANGAATGAAGAGTAGAYGSTRRHHRRRSSEGNANDATMQVQSTP